MAADVQQSTANLRLIGLDHKKHEGRLLRRPRAPKSKEITENNLKALDPLPDIQSNRQLYHIGEESPVASHLGETNTSIVISPPPPSTDLYPCNAVQVHSSSANASSSKPKSRQKALNRFYLDSSHRERTNLGTYVEGKGEASLVKPWKPKGPDGLYTVLKPRRKPPPFQTIPMEDEERYFRPPDFTLEDFMRSLSDRCKYPIEKVENIVYSKQNYKRMIQIVQKILQLNKNQEMINNFTMTGEESGLPVRERRKPNKQFLLEIAQMVKDEMVANGLMESDAKTTIRTVKKFEFVPKVPGGMTAHSEIIVYEDDTKIRRVKDIESRRATEVPTKEGIFKTNVSRTFMGSGRCSSPFEMTGGDAAITPEELAVLDALFCGGRALSLKACFISSLPDIEPLYSTLTYLNLSFNTFIEIPKEIFDLSLLTTLKLRDNPIRSIHHEIGRLNNLRVFVASFCLISSLPVSLFILESLQHLDVSYNKLSFIPNEIKYLVNLRELNVEGNQLPAMPSGALNLTKLIKLNVRNNLMHPLFWKEHSKNTPQRLLELAATAIDRWSLYSRYNLTEEIIDILESRQPCECCSQAMYGPGFRIIIPVIKLFGVKNLPFLFRSCSPICRDMFRSDPTSFVNVIYKLASEGEEEEEEE
ncbi:DgyrCDS5467 [Dimorphilus gyrociliatus]|uniref:DgyrCDS5467 n=1 Tax=Dimorphilus gyrociliatus TaxID=2664684 RepID=A0A7I8VMN4_9ANNE|nr:DgyrCDS5467 [Dimorphilus gyrociliatus]